MGGTDSVTLIVSEMPVHTHTVNSLTALATTTTPTSGTTIGRSVNGPAFADTASGFQTFAPEALTPAGGSLPHNNLQPYLTLNYVIALQGVYPARP
jgi:microcystin-dependent protein